MEKVAFSRTMMTKPYRGHPNEDALERFLLKLLDEDELEIVETHIFACSACLDRLEALELHIAAAKLACKEHLAAPAANVAHPRSQFSFSSWLTLPRLSIAGGALAACALLLTIASRPQQVSVSAFRGSEVTYVDVWVPLALHLDAKDLPSGPLAVRVVNSRGGEIWHGPATSAHDQIDVTIPRLTSSSHFFIRVYATQEDASGSLLREYSVETKPLLH